MSIFFMNGDVNSNMRVNSDSKLFKWLEDNHYIDNNQFALYKEVFEEIQDKKPELDKDEEILLGHLLFNLSYNGGYIFREVKTFEDKISYIKEKHLIGEDLVNSDQHDVIVMIRCIENHKEEIRSNPIFLLPKITLDDIHDIYSELCGTQLHNSVFELPLNVMQEAINLCFME